MFLKRLIPILLIAAFAVILVRFHDAELGFQIASDTNVENRQTDRSVSMTMETDIDALVDRDSFVPPLESVEDTVLDPPRGRQARTESAKRASNSRGFGADQFVLTNSDDSNLSDSQARAKGQGPFKVSDAVLESCEGLSHLPDTDDSGPSSVDPSCAELRKYLLVFEDEARDHTWATAMEEKLLDHVASAPNQCRVRLLECRETVCAFECESVAGPLYRRDDNLKERLRHVDSMFGYENDAVGVRLTVTLAVYVRR